MQNKRKAYIKEQRTMSHRDLYPNRLELIEHFYSCSSCISPTTHIHKVLYPVHFKHYQTHHYSTASGLTGVQLVDWRWPAGYMIRVVKFQYFSHDSSNR